MQKKNKYIDRISFSQIDAPIEIPDLLEVQKKSYKTFLQIDELPALESGEMPVKLSDEIITDQIDDSQTGQSKDSNDWRSDESKTTL